MRYSIGCWTMRPSGGARIVYIYAVVAANIYLLRCYAKNVKTDLTEREKKELRRIVALKVVRQDAKESGY